jgi:2',3'-cyclic-nucleotide 2'-phosphodiesterase / 3'-nucleotidase
VFRTRLRIALPTSPPWTILTKTVRDNEGAAHQLKVGVVGFVTPDIVRWDMSHLAGRATTLGIVEAARTHVPACRAAGADVIVALCHAGISKIGPAGAGENAALALAESGGLDALFIGHQHLRLPGPDFSGIPGVDTDGKLAGVPAVMAGFWAGHIGLIDLTLEREPAGWRVAASRSQLRAVEPATPPAPAVLAATAQAHESTLAYTRAPVGEADAPLASYFAMIGDDPSVRIVHDAQLWYVRRLMDSIPALREAPLLSASAPFKCGGRNGADYYSQVPAGPIALRHVADLYVYPNGLRVVRATGAMIREWLERAASVFETLNPQETAPQPLLAPAFAAYDFDQIDGVAYRLDLTQPPRYDDQGRLIDAQAHRVTGLDLPDDAPFLVVTNSYRASGGGHFPGCDGSTVVYEAPDTNFDALLQYVRSQKRVRPSPGGLWRLAPWPASVTAILNAPPAAADFSTPPGVEATPLGPAPDGFLSFRITTQV